MNDSALDQTHRANFHWCLQTLRLHNFGRFSQAFPGVSEAQSSSATQRSWLQTVAYAKHPARLLAESQDTSDIALQTGCFERKAYGAALGLIYYRALSDSGRRQWDAQALAEVECGMKISSGIVKQGRANQQAALGGNPAALMVMRDRLGRAKLAADQYSIYFQQLYSIRRQAFTGTEFAQINRNVDVVSNPWCQSDLEFRTTANWMLSRDKPDGLPRLTRGYVDDADTPDVDADESEATKLLHTAMNAKATEFIGEFLKESASKVTGLLGIGLQEIVEKMPVADIIWDMVAEFLKAQRMDTLIEWYKEDEQRSFFLRSLNWGTYSRSAASAFPSGGIQGGLIN